MAWLVFGAMGVEYRRAGVKYGRDTQWWQQMPALLYTVQSTVYTVQTKVYCILPTLYSQQWNIQCTGGTGLAESRHLTGRNQPVNWQTNYHNIIKQLPAVIRHSQDIYINRRTCGDNTLPLLGMRAKKKLCSPCLQRYTTFLAQCSVLRKYVRNIISSEKYVSFYLFCDILV